MNIEYPTIEEMNESIKTILTKAYSKRENVFLYLYHLYRQLGMEILMHGVKGLFVVTIVLYAILIVVQQDLEKSSQMEAYMQMAMLSPLIFQFILGLAVVNEKEQKTYEVQQTCKYTIYHIQALRMVLAGGFSLVMNFIFCLFLYGNQGTGTLIHMMFWNVTVLLTYSLLYLMLLIRSVQVIKQFVLYGVWALGNYLFAVVFPKVYLLVCIQFPLFLHVI
ncbi:MAG: hypothetical protein IIV45_16635, partial [Lachnospiraceae bacterium]|nr:hypothetical protein [Lachnospiraceae bacterium]